MTGASNLLILIQNFCAIFCLLTAESFGQHATSFIAAAAQEPSDLVSDAGGVTRGRPQSIAGKLRSAADFRLRCRMSLAYRKKLGPEKSGRLAKRKPLRSRFARFSF